MRTYEITYTAIMPNTMLRRGGFKTVEAENETTAEILAQKRVLEENPNARVIIQSVEDISKRI